MINEDDYWWWTMQGEQLNRVEANLDTINNEVMLTTNIIHDDDDDDENGFG